MNKNRWLLSTICGMGLLAGSAGGAFAQNVPSENATAPAGSGSATQTITLKPGQEAGTHTVLPADTAGNPNASAEDARFVMKASADGMAEIMMGHLALNRGQTQAVRDAGQLMITDHTQANDTLMGIAQTVTLRTAHGPNAMQREMYQQVASAPAGQFDAMWTNDMVQSHRQAIALFKMEGHMGQSPQLRQFAMTTLPVLYHHLHVLQGLSPMHPMQNASAQASPVMGNPDHSADQLNARELTGSNPS